MIRRFLQENESWILFRGKKRRRRENIILKVFRKRDIFIYNRVLRVEVWCLFFFSDSPIIIMNNFSFKCFCFSYEKRENEKNFILTILVRILSVIEGLVI